MNRYGVFPITRFCHKNPPALPPFTETDTCAAIEGRRRFIGRATCLGLFGTSGANPHVIPTRRGLGDQYKTKNKQELDAVAE
jgi:hypothetical protein